MSVSLQPLDDGGDVTEFLDGGRPQRGVRSVAAVRFEVAAVRFEVVAVPTVASPVAVVLLVGEIVIDAVGLLKWTSDKNAPE